MHTHPKGLAGWLAIVAIVAIDRYKVEETPG